MAARPSAGLSDGAQAYDSNTNVIRNILGSGGIHTHIFMNPTDPEDSRNNALAINVDNVGGGSSIDPMWQLVRTALRQLPSLSISP